jgi:glycosyltransferase involved in cell wall biosynthesis
MRARVCYVVNAVGESSVPADIARSLVKYTDVDVDILAWFEAEPFEGDDQIDVTCLRAPDTTLGVDGETVRDARRFLGKYDLVQAHHNHSGAFAKLIAKSLQIPSVSREGNMRKGFNSLGLTANGLTNPLADRVVCNSQAVYDSFRWWETALLPPEKVTLIPNGVDFDRLSAGRNADWSAIEAANADDDSVLVGTAGMLTEQKDHKTLIRAMASARERSDQRLELVLAGDGPQESALQTLVSNLGLSDSVHFLGYVDRRRVYKLLSEIEIYAMPSLWEGFSAAAVEALAAKNAAIFSTIPPFTGPYEDVARFHPAGDHDVLADHLVELANDPVERDQLAQAGLDLVKRKYTVESIARQYQDLYEEILRTR